MGINRDQGHFSVCHHGHTQPHGVTDTPGHHLNHQVLELLITQSDHSQHRDYKTTAASLVMHPSNAQSSVQYSRTPVQQPPWDQRVFGILKNIITESSLFPMDDTFIT